MSAEGNADVMNHEHTMTEESRSVDDVQASSKAAPQHEPTGQECKSWILDQLNPRLCDADFKKLPFHVYRYHLTPEERDLVANLFPEDLPADGKIVKTSLLNRLKAWTRSLCRSDSPFDSSSPEDSLQAWRTVTRLSSLTREHVPFDFILTPKHVIACPSHLRAGRDNTHLLLSKFSPQPDTVKMAGTLRWKTVKDLPSASNVDGPHTRVSKLQLDYVDMSKVYAVKQHHIDALRSLIATVFPGVNLVRTRRNA